MIFSSGLFLWLFLGFSFIYMLLSKNRMTTARLIYVTAFSYFFYYKSSGLCFFLLALVTLSDHKAASIIARSTPKGIKAKTVLGISVFLDLLLLGIFKYTNFFGSLLVNDWHNLDIILPVGISFFTFQSMSYTIDVYRGIIRPIPLLDYAFYVSFFPQLVAGPIVRAADFIPQIRQKLHLSSAMIGEGVFLIAAGLFKKAVISDYISVNFVERIFDQPTLYSGVENLLAIYGYTLQIYCDFSGYSDMAIGIALLLGFRFPQNFNSPYKSLSITEFWRRWHISLSSWLKDYLYISLGGNRRGKVRQYINLMLTMLLGGLWHGASLNFVIWGGMHGLFLCLDKIWHSICPALSPLKTLAKKTEQEKSDEGGVTSLALCISHFAFRISTFLITFHIVAALWVLFRAQDFQTATDIFTQIHTSFHPQVFTQWVVSYSGVAFLMALGYAMHFVPERLTEIGKNLVTHMPLILQALIIVAVAWIVIQIKSSDIQPFIYFQF